MAKQNYIATPAAANATVEIDTASIPAYTGVHIAQFTLEALRRDYARPEVQEEYQKWKAARAVRSA